MEEILSGCRCLWMCLGKRSGAVERGARSSLRCFLILAIVFASPNFRQRLSASRCSPPTRFNDRTGATRCTKTLKLDSPESQEYAASVGLRRPYAPDQCVGAAECSNSVPGDAHHSATRGRHARAEVL